MKVFEVSQLTRFEEKSPKKESAGHEQPNDWSSLNYYMHPPLQWDCDCVHSQVCNTIPAYNVCLHNLNTSDLKHDTKRVPHP